VSYINSSFSAEGEWKIMGIKEVKGAGGFMKPCKS